jgi:hypothetical protein
MENNVPRRLLALVRRGTVDQVAALLDGGSSDREEASRHVNTAFEGVTPMVRPMLTWRGWHRNCHLFATLATDHQNAAAIRWRRWMRGVRTWCACSWRQVHSALYRTL